MPDPSAPAPARPEHALLIVIVPAGTQFEAIVVALLDVGLSGTVLDGKGVTAIMREEMPIFGGLASMLPNSAGTRLILVATTRTRAAEAMALFQSDFTPTDRPIAMVLGISDAIGIRH